MTWIENASGDSRKEIKQKFGSVLEDSHIQRLHEYSPKYAFTLAHWLASYMQYTGGFRVVDRVFDDFLNHMDKLGGVRYLDAHPGDEKTRGISAKRGKDLYKKDDKRVRFIPDEKDPQDTYFGKWEYIGLRDLPWLQLVELLQEWVYMKEAPKRAAYTFDDGWFWVEVGDCAAMEAKLMQHCASDPNGRLYSLRDPAGNPHVTLTMNHKNVVSQIKGKNNEVPNRQYWEYIKAFIDDFEGSSLNLHSVEGYNTEFVAFLGGGLVLKTKYGTWLELPASAWPLEALLETVGTDRVYRLVNNDGIETLVLLADASGGIVRSYAPLGTQEDHPAAVAALKNARGVTSSWFLSSFDVVAWFPEELEESGLSGFVWRTAVPTFQEWQRDVALHGDIAMMHMHHAVLLHDFKRRDPPKYNVSLARINPGYDELNAIFDIQVPAERLAITQEALACVMAAPAYLGDRPLKLVPYSDAVWAYLRTEADRLFGGIYDEGWHEAVRRAKKGDTAGVLRLLDRTEEVFEPTSKELEPQEETQNPDFDPEEENPTVDPTDLQLRLWNDAKFTAIRVMQAIAKSSGVEDRLDAAVKYITNLQFVCVNRPSRVGGKAKTRGVVELNCWTCDTEEQARDTILHEVAHQVVFALYRETGHGTLWKFIAKLMGADPHAVAHKMPAEKAKQLRRGVHHIATCRQGHEAHIGPKVWERFKADPSRFRCPHCYESFVSVREDE